MMIRITPRGFEVNDRSVCQDRTSSFTSQQSQKRTFDSSERPPLADITNFKRRKIDNLSYKSETPPASTLPNTVVNDSVAINTTSFTKISEIQRRLESLQPMLGVSTRRSGLLEAFQHMAMATCMLCKLSNPLSKEKFHPPQRCPTLSRVLDRTYRTYDDLFVEYRTRSGETCCYQCENMKLTMQQAPSLIFDTLTCIYRYLYFSIALLTGHDWRFNTIVSSIAGRTFDDIDEFINWLARSTSLWEVTPTNAFVVYLAAMVSDARKRIFL